MPSDGIDAPQNPANYFVGRLGEVPPGEPDRWYLVVEPFGDGRGRVCLTDEEGRPEACEVGAFGVLWSILQRSHLGGVTVAALFVQAAIGALLLCLGGTLP